MFLWLAFACSLCPKTAPATPGAPLPADPVAKAARALPAIPRTAKTGAEVFGINEALSMPRRWIDRGLLRPEDEGAELQKDAVAVLGLGAHVVRGNSAVYPYFSQYDIERANWDLTRLDLWMQTVQDAGLEPIIVLGPWPGTQTASYTDHYLPTDMSAYLAYVTRLVERYDGDGQDDMPGLKAGVVYWEVDNEPDLHNSAPPRDGGSKVKPQDFETPEEYAKLLIATSAAIRAASPTAKVLGGGFYNVRSPSGGAYVQRLVAQPGVLDAIDIVSVHCYFDENSTQPVVQTLAVVHERFPGKGVWITETGVPAMGSPPEESQRWQAGMVVAVYGEALAGGADRVIWHTLADPPLSEERSRRLPFSTHSLLRVLPPTGAVGEQILGPGGKTEDKPAGAVYRRLSGLLATTDPAVYRREDSGEGRMLWTGEGWLLYWGAAVAPEGVVEVTDLRTGVRGPASGTLEAPVYFHLAR